MGGSKRTHCGPHFSASPPRGSARHGHEGDEGYEGCQGRGGAEGNEGQVGWANTAGLRWDKGENDRRPQEGGPPQNKRVKGEYSCFPMMSTLFRERALFGHAAAAVVHS